MNRITFYPHCGFWKEQPALLLGLCALIGTSSFLFWPSPWNWMFPLFWALYLLSLRSWPAIVFLLGSILYTFFLYSSPPTGNCGYFSIATLQPHQSPFQKGLVYKGALYIDHKKVPCSVHHPIPNHPKANCDYILKGALIQRSPSDYLFKCKQWIPVEKTWSPAEIRYELKERLRLFLSQKLQRPRTASFLSSLLTGDVEDRALRYEFSRLGLQHILAISGFHFAILIGFCSFFLSLFLPYRWKLIALLVAINAYFLFVGSVPAVQRSWLTAVLYLVGKLTGRHASGLNLLGIALLIEVLLDPLVSANLGFQLSFLSCLGILLFLPRLPPPPSDLPFFSQHVRLLSTFFRQGLAITFAVNLAILPLLLVHFHKFPLLSLLYNLFFPLLVSVALFSLLLSFVVYLLFPPLAPFGLVDWFTAQLLDLTAYPPPPLNYSIQISSFPMWIIPFYLFVLFCLTNSNLSGKILGFYGDRSSAG